MKKKIFTTIAFALVAVLILGLSACAPNAEKLLSEYNVTENVVALNNITVTEDSTVNFDNHGVALIVNSQTNENDTTNTTYSLYNFKTDTVIINKTLVDEGEIAFDSAYGAKVKHSGIKRSTSGFYYSTVSIYDSEEKLKTTKYTLYDANGTVATDIEGEFSKPSVFTAIDGTQYYLFKNSVKTETNFFARIPGDLVSIGEYMVESDDDLMFAVFDKDGKFVRDVDLWLLMEIPEGVSEYEFWVVDTTIFVQYKLQLLEGETDYDFMEYDYNDNLQKYNLCTKSYDFDSQKIKSYEMEYIVNYPESEFNIENAILYVNKIVDKRVSETQIVQSFDDSANVLVDIQKLVPGASDVAHVNYFEKIFAFTALATDYIVKDSEIIASFPSDLVAYQGNSVIYEDDEIIRIYSFDGELKANYSGVEDWSFTESYVSSCITIQLQDKVIKYDLNTHDVSVVSLVGENDTVTLLSNYVLIGNESMYNCYSLILGIPDALNLSEEAAYNYQFSNVGFAYDRGYDTLEIVRVFMVKTKLANGSFDFKYYKQTIEAAYE